MAIEPSFDWLLIIMGAGERISITQRNGSPQLTALSTLIESSWSAIISPKNTPKRMPYKFLMPSDKKKMKQKHLDFVIGLVAFVGHKKQEFKRILNQ